MALIPLESRSDLDDALGRPLAILFKHSPRCGISAAAHHEVERFVEAHPDVPVFRIDVLAARDVSDAVAERFGIVHHSPQVILCRDGRAVWNASHYAVRSDRLAEQVEARA